MAGSVGAGREVANEADISHEARIISLQDTTFWTAKIIVDILTVYIELCRINMIPVNLLMHVR